VSHYPVMLPEVLSALAPQDGETYVDGTFGNGGYSEAFLKAVNCNVIGLDRDPNVKPRAQELAQNYDDRFRLIETPFSKMDKVGVKQVDAVILDIGVSSMQLDQAERGFSFMRSGPLDMRMGTNGATAADAIKSLSHNDLIRVFQVYGEERRARRAADFIARAREAGDIVTTDALARLVVVTFHSLEDRIVKAFLRRRSGEVIGGSRYAPEVKSSGPAASFTQMKRSVVKPSKSEITENSRSRSAKLRAAIRSEAIPFPMDDNLLPNVPSVHDLKALS